MRGALGHAAAAAARTEAAALARERHEALGVTLGALKPREAAGPDAAGEEVTELLLDKRRQSAAIGIGGAQKRRKMVAHESVEHRMLGSTRPVRRHAAGRHAEST